MPLEPGEPPKVVGEVRHVDQMRAQAMPIVRTISPILI